MTLDRIALQRELMQHTHKARRDAVYVAPEALEEHWCKAIAGAAYLVDNALSPEIARLEGEAAAVEAECTHVEKRMTELEVMARAADGRGDGVLYSARTAIDEARGDRKESRAETVRRIISERDTHAARVRELEAAQRGAGPSPDINVIGLVSK